MLHLLLLFSLDFLLLLDFQKTKISYHLDISDASIFCYYYNMGDVTSPQESNPEALIAANASVLAHELGDDLEILNQRWQQFVAEHPKSAGVLRQIANKVSHGDTSLKELFLCGFTLELVLRERTDAGQLMEPLLHGEATGTID